jgi:hypothetical protein
LYSIIAITYNYSVAVPANGAKSGTAPDFARGYLIATRIESGLLTKQSALGKQFFFEKKNQKTFIHFERVPVVPAASTDRTKVFCFFFSKKKYFLASPV